MDFEQYIDENIRMTETLCSIVEKKDFNGAEVARELGISRVAVHKITQKAIPKVYESVKKAMGPDYSPLKCFVLLSRVLQTEEDSNGIKLIVKNLSNEQKADVLSDIKTNYPMYKDMVPDLF